MKLIIDIPNEVLKTRHYCQYFGAWSTKLTETIENGIPYEERPQVTVFCENADENAIADMKEELQKVIDDLRPQGEWIKAVVDGKRVFWFCKKCEYPLFSEPKTNFCPNCGADMRKGGADNDG